jgi:transposase
MKDPHFISWSPMYHWTDDKIQVHAFYCVLALTMVSLLRKILYKAGVDISIPAMLEELSGIYEVAHFYPEGSKQKDHYTLSAANELQQQLIDKLEIVKVHQG